MNKKWSMRVPLAIFILAVLFISPLAVPVAADGGPIIPDPYLWSSLTQNQQIAVVRINRDDTMNIDLFISLQDSSGESHEITYFLPLGKFPSGFQAAETTSVAFDMELTQTLDRLLADEDRYKEYTQAALLPGPVFLHGVWLLPALVPLAFNGCSAGNVPEASLNTPSSQINIYGLDTETDISELIDTAGLDRSVQDTLERLRGQKIAVVKLITQPVVSTPEGHFGNRGQPGLHFSWTAPATFSSDSSEPAFTYPLGTGSAWARPVEISRVYVVAPRDLTFQVHYPELGEFYSATAVSDIVYKMHDISVLDRPAYSVEETLDSRDRIWRATYRLSNSAEDIVITVTEPEGVGGWIGSTFPLYIPFGFTVLISIFVSLLLWIITWRYILPRRMPLLRYSWKEKRLWSDALIFPAINLGMFFIYLPLAGGIVALIGIALYHAIPVNLITGFITGILAIAALAVLLCLPVWVFIQKFKESSGQSKTRMAVSYIFIVVSANIAYLIFGVAYAAATGAL